MKPLIIFVGILCLALANAGDQAADAQEEFAEKDAAPDEETPPMSAADDLERSQGDGDDADLPELPNTEDFVGKSLTIAGDDISQCLKMTYLSFYVPPIKTYGCCLQRWNYRCYSSSYRMPCFYDRTTRYYCCSLVPIYARRCLCRSCTVLGSDCVQKGYCARRYVRRSFFAICRRNNFWFYLRRITKLVPSSCYCRVRNYYTTANTLEAIATKTKTIS